MPALPSMKPQRRRLTLWPLLACRTEGLALTFPRLELVACLQILKKVVDTAAPHVAKQMLLNRAYFVILGKAPPFNLSSKGGPRH